MKKLVLLLASFCLMTAASAAYKDGTYEGQGDGNHGKIDVSVVIKGGKIADIKVLKHTETDMIIQSLSLSSLTWSARLRSRSAIASISSARVLSAAAASLS